MPGDFELGASEGRIDHAPPSARGLHDRVGDGEPETGPRTVVGSPVEAVEQSGALFGRDPRSAVLDGDAGSVDLGRHDDTDDAFASGVTTSVVHQYTAESVDPVGRGGDKWFGVAAALDEQGDSPCLCHGPEAVGATLGNRKDVNKLVPRRGGL